MLVRLPPCWLLNSPVLVPRLYRRCDLAGCYRDYCRFKVRQTGVGQQRAALVEQCTSQLQVQVSIAADAAVAVVEPSGTRLHTRCRNQASDVGQCLIDAHGQTLVAEQLAVGVVEALRRQAERLGTGYFPALVSDGIEVFQQQLTRCRQKAALVVQLAIAQVQGNIRAAEQLPARVLIEAGDGCGQRHGAGDAASHTVIHLAGRETERTSAGQASALLVGERAGVEYYAFTGDATLLAVIETAAVQGQTGVGQQGAALAIAPLLVTVNPPTPDTLPPLLPRLAACSVSVPSPRRVPACCSIDWPGSG